MRKLLTRLAVGLVVAVLLTAAAVASGRTLPAPPEIAVLHLADCKPPCWIGIVPGQTTLRDAKRLINRTYWDTSKYQISPYDLNPDSVFEISGPGLPPSIKLRIGMGITPNGSHLEDAVISSIAVTILSDVEPLDRVTLPLAELYNSFPPPDVIALIVSDGGSALDLQSTSTRIDVVLASSFYRWDCAPLPSSSSVLTIEFYNPSSKRPPQEIHIRPWQGFRKCYDLQLETN